MAKVQKFPIVLPLVLVEVSQTLAKPIVKSSSWLDTDRNAATILSVVSMGALVVLDNDAVDSVCYGVLLAIAVISTAVAIAPSRRDITSHSPKGNSIINNVDSFAHHLTKSLGNNEMSIFNTRYGQLKLASGNPLSMEKKTPGYNGLQLLAHGDFTLRTKDIKIIFPIVVASSNSGIHVATSHVYTLAELSEKLVEYQSPDALNETDTNEEVSWVSYNFNPGDTPGSSGKEYDNRAEIYINSYGGIGKYSDA